MKFDEIIEKMTLGGYETSAEHLSHLVAVVGRELKTQHDGNELAAHQEAKSSFASRVMEWVDAGPMDDIHPVSVLRCGPTYSYSWATAMILHRIDNPEQDGESEYTEVPDLFLLGLMKTNNDLSTKVLEVASMLEKSLRAEALLKEYEKLDALLDALKAPVWNEVGTRKLSVIERVEALEVKHRDMVSLCEDQNITLKAEYDDAMRLVEYREADHARLLAAFTALREKYNLTADGKAELACLLANRESGA